MINTEAHETIEIMWYPNTHNIQYPCYDACDGKGAIWFGLVLWTKLATNGEKLLKRLKLLREKDQSLWALSEYGERIWKLPTLARLESIWNQWTVASTHIFKVSIPQILSQNFLFSHPLPSTNKFLVSIPRIFSANSLLFTGSASTVHFLFVFLLPDIF